MYSCVLHQITVKAVYILIRFESQVETEKIYLSLEGEILPKVGGRVSKIGGKTVGIIIGGMEGRPPRPGRGGSTEDGPPRPTGRPVLIEDSLNFFVCNKNLDIFRPT